MSCKTSKILDYLRFLNFKKNNYYLNNGVDLIDILIENVNFNKHTNHNDRYEFIYNNLYIIKEYVDEIKKRLNDYDFNLFLNHENPNIKDEINCKELKNSIIEKEIELIKYYRSKIINNNNSYKFDLYANLDTHLDDLTCFNEDINIDLHLNSITPPIHQDYNNKDLTDKFDNDILIDLETSEKSYLDNYFEEGIKNHLMCTGNIKKKKIKSLNTTKKVSRNNKNKRIKISI